MRVRRSRGKVDTYMIEIELPWPDKALNPNSRNRWGKVKAKSVARDIGYFTTRDTPTVWVRYGIPDEITAQYTFCPPDKRHRDIDNCLSMMKAAQDGVCSALGIDDSRIKRTILEWGEVVKGGCVVLRLEEMERYD